MARQKNEYEGVIFKRGRIWCVRFYTRNEDGSLVRIQHSLGVTNKDEAETKAIEFTKLYALKNEAQRRAAIAAHIADPVDKVKKLEADRKRTLIADGWQEFPYIERVRGSERKRLGAKQVANNKQFWRLFAEWMAKTKPTAKYMQDVTEADAHAYSNYCRDEAGLSERSCNKRAEIARVVFDIAKIEPNPFANVRRWSESNEGRECLELDELQRILEVTTGEMRVLVMLGALTGMRLGDCATLGWHEIRNGRIYKRTSKTGKEVSLSIAPALAEAIATLPHPKGAIYVMPEIAASYKHDNTAISKRIRRLFESCGIQVVEPATEGRIKAISRRGFHSLRATFITFAARSNIPTKLISGWIGHSDQVDKLYQKFGNADRDERILEALAPVAALASSPPVIDVDAVELPDPDAIRAEILRRLETADQETLARVLAAF
jgi:integrase